MTHGLRHISVNWHDLSDWLGVEYTKPADNAIIRSINEGYAAWIEELEKQATWLTEDDRRNALFVFDRLAFHHWSLPVVLSHNLDIDAMIDIVNEFNQDDGIVDWLEHDDGVEFIVASSVLDMCKKSDECSGSSSKAEPLVVRRLGERDLVLSIKKVLTCLGYETIAIDLSDWDTERPLPSYKETLSYIRSRKRRSHRNSNHDNTKGKRHTKNTGHEPRSVAI